MNAIGHGLWKVRHEVCLVDAFVYGGLHLTEVCVKLQSFQAVFEWLKVNVAVRGCEC